MANVTVAEHIKASPEKVWEVIGKFDALHKWAPGIKESKAEGVGIGARRTLTFNGGGRITERLISKAENPPAYTYSIEQGDLPVNDHISTLMVVDHGDGSCTVSWVCTVFLNWRISSWAAAQALLVHLVAQALNGGLQLSDLVGRVGGSLLHAGVGVETLLVELIAQGLHGLPKLTQFLGRLSDRGLDALVRLETQALHLIAQRLDGRLEFAHLGIAPGHRLLHACQGNVVRLLEGTPQRDHGRPQLP